MRCPSCAGRSTRSTTRVKSRGRQCQPVLPKKRKSTMHKLKLIGFCTLLAVNGLAHAAGADDYPSRAVRLVVPFAPGTSGLVSRRPVRGEDVENAGLRRVAASTVDTYPSRSVRM